MDGEKFKKSLEEAISKSPQRKFEESIELALNLKDLDLSNPKNRLNEEIVLPNGRGKKLKVGLISGNEMASRAKGAVDRFISADELDKMVDDKKNAKRMVNDIDYFLAETALMPRVGKILGGIMGPRGKVPRPLPPNADPVPVINNLRRTVKARSKEKPVVHIPIGTRGMEIDKVVQNAVEVVNRIQTKLEKGEENIRTIYVKTTMGPAIKVEMR